ncbi:Late embryogenesis abundant protein [Theobroma cacao]|nr:Late embryogenesis abundant protein [Theobroma cacao]
MAFLVLLAASVYIFWPSQPEVKIVRMHVKRMQMHTVPIIALDISLLVTLKVRNSDVYSMDFTSLDMAVGYRGKMLGHVKSEHDHLRAWGSSYLQAELELNGVEVLSDVVYMLEDLARGTVPFDTITEVAGWLGLSLFKFPLKNQSDYHPPKLLPAAKDASTKMKLKALDMTSSAVDCMKCSKAERFTGIPDLRL